MLSLAGQGRQDRGDSWAAESGGTAALAMTRSTLSRPNASVGAGCFPAWCGGVVAEDAVEGGLGGGPVEAGQAGAEGGVAVQGGPDGDGVGVGVVAGDLAGAGAVAQAGDELVEGFGPDGHPAGRAVAQVLVAAEQHPVLARPLVGEAQVGGAEAGRNRPSGSGWLSIACSTTVRSSLEQSSMTA